MSRLIVALISGIIFGAGLCLSEMINPQKVISFLDITGNWDPSLAFVMGGALFVTFIGFKFILKFDDPIFDDQFSLPTKEDVDKPLLIGAVIFGAGWGLSGLCPGPAFAGIGLQLTEAFIMVASIYVGFLCHRFMTSD